MVQGTAPVPVLAVNSGSSSLKFTLYQMGPGVEQPLAVGAVERIGLPAGRLWLDRDGARVLDEGESFPRHRDAVAAMFRALEGQGLPAPAAVGHRFVSGGPRYRRHCRITPAFRADIRNYLAFAPLHLPPAIAAVEAVAAEWGAVPQVACFDTAFHRQLPERAARLPLPRNLWHEGVRRYGFHGLSYEYLLSRLGPDGGGRAVLAHLGNGASLAAVDHGEPMDTTMGLTPTGGLMMGTRSGDLDPGVLLYLLNEKGYDARQLERLLDHLSGLLGVSGVSSDMQTLLARAPQDAHAAQAVELFAYSAAKAVGAMAVALGGLDTLVFSGGIGEHAAPVRAAICRPLAFLGIRLDPEANARQAPLISAPASRVHVRVIPTDEDRVIARHTYRLYQKGEDCR
ncbi:Acetate kinase [Candidatus Hydrogenisulfobacillus filiaventi]|uniref:Acetate kinase n=1 Tax=Candidatus Hydrogenisulfobacillus filiaventi TaxID=2707344 RepID=A0A6F8ZKI7_9FIRM|nr:Acetate kinase [Candidatus Hydrogenisulfobacillus filiaventi]